MCHEPGRSSGSTLEPIVEPPQSNSEVSDPPGSQTSVFGTQQQSDFFDAPSQDSQQSATPAAPMSYISRTPTFDYQAALWQSIIDGQDLWAEEP